jgi:diguanylate cyclase (GGDEF)-like protein
MRGLVERACEAAVDILAHERLRRQAFTDSLTGLGNRRRLIADVERFLAAASEERPLMLVLFDLDGFKSYNDTFGHQAGDAVLARLGGRLETAIVAHGGSAYRLGGDEFCVLVAPRDDAAAVVAEAVSALSERGENFAVGASFGAATLPQEATDLEHALQLADERMYSHKRGRSSLAGEQAHEMLVHVLQAKQPVLVEHSSDVTELCVRVGRRLGMTGDSLDCLRRAAALHDIGKLGIPDAILRKSAPLSEAEWDFVKQHTVLGARILSAVPALQPVAAVVRATHERWDGSGYPDGLAGEQIPLAARVIAACDAYEAISSNRTYRPGRDAEHARAELRRCAGGQFDPTVVDAVIAELEVPARSDCDRSRRAAARRRGGVASVATRTG